MRTHRGFTLVEILIAIVIMGFLGAAITRVLTSQQRLATATTERAAVSQNMRAAMGVIAGELREISTTSAGVSDILSFSSNLIQYRAMRSTGEACGIAANQVLVLRSSLYGSRPITASTDALLLFQENDNTILTDDAWLTLPINAVVSSTCGGNAAFMITTSLNLATYPLTTFQLNAPIRTYEVMEVGTVVVSGQTYVGARSVSGGQATLLPVAGPILSANGLQFTGYTSAGVATSTPSQIRSIEIAVRAISDVSVRAGGSTTLAPIQDSLIMQVQLRNTP
jgi:prepilin-type N-terminal cleavage/methylation domain-containing protein